MEQRETDLLRDTLANNFDLAINDLVSEAKIIEALTLRVEELIAGNPDQLFSMLYRLDISERKIKAALAFDVEVSKKIAVLIYERQLEKIVSRNQFRSTKPDDDLAW